MRDRCLGRTTVLAGQVGIQAQALVDCLQPGGVDADLVHEVTEFPRELRDSVVSLAQRRRQGLHLGTHGRKAGHKRGRLPHELRRVGGRLVVLQQFRCEVEIALDVLGAG